MKPFLLTLAFLKGICIAVFAQVRASRLDEYSPWVNPSYGGGQGASYVAFITETLKPFIDNNYRTLPQRDHTGIMGSSMGGLISLYAAIERQDIFGKAGVFSASFWFAEECYTHVSNTGKQSDMRIYLIAGGQEGSNNQQVADMLEMEETLLLAGFSSTEIRTEGHPDGAHSEWYWRREFPTAYEWLFKPSMTPVSDHGNFADDVVVSPNPGEDTVQVELPDDAQDITLVVSSMAGKIIRLIPAAEGRMSLTGLPSGAYLLSFYHKDRQYLGTKQLVIK